MSSETKWYRVKIVFAEPLLGAAPLNKELYKDYIATKANGNGNSNGNVEDEALTIEEAAEKGMTGFHRNLQTKQPFLMNYVI